MTSFPLIFAAFLFPLVLLLLLGLRKRRRLAYPHLLFEDSRLPPLIRFLLREWRSLFDLIFDIALAAIAAAWLSSFLDPESGRSAFVIDGSYSMRLGTEGERPIDKAISALKRDLDASPGGRVFILGADPRTGQPALSDLTGKLRRRSKQEILARLGRANAFLNLDYGLLKDLPPRGYRKVVFYTDSFPYRAEGFTVAESGFPASPFSWPSAVLLDPRSGESIIALTRHQDISVPALSRIDPETGREVFTSGIAIRGEQGAARAGAGSARAVFRTREEGLFRLKVGAAEYFLILGKPRMEARAEGDISESILSLFPFSEKTETGGIFLRDSEELPDIRKTGKKEIISYYNKEIYETTEMSLIPPEYGFGYPIPGGSRGEGIFLLSPQAIGNENLPLAYYTELLSFRGEPFSDFPPEKSRFLFGSSSSAVYRIGGGNGIATVCVSPGELFETRSETAFTLEPYGRPSLLLALLAAALYAAKLAFFLRYQRRVKTPGNEGKGASAASGGEAGEMPPRP